MDTLTSKLLSSHAPVRKFKNLKLIVHGHRKMYWLHVITKYDDVNIEAKTDLFIFTSYIQIGW